MKPDEVIIRVGGAAGDGVQSAGLILAKTFSRSGLHVNTYNYYQSIIRGGYSWYQVRASDRKVKSQGDGLDILIALNKDALERHTNPNINEGGASPLSEDGIAIFDDSIKGYKQEKVNYVSMPLTSIASKYSRNALMKNTVAIGAAMASIGMDFEVLAGVIRDQFGNKGEVAEQNVNAAKEGYEYYLKNFKKLNKKLKTSNKRYYLISGGEAVGLGAVSAGLKMYFGYPMTPASSALHFLASHAKKFGVFVKIPEDEISAINMAIGANYAGVRAMTGSSGGGFSLMVEALGMAGMMEVPLVVYEAQRAGPSTGLPTKTEQGDLNLVLGASQGDFPRIVLAARDVKDAYDLAREALNLAEKYQTPVILMSDLYIAEHYETVENLDTSVRIERGKYAEENTPDYKRYALTDDGISPRAIPGMSGLMHNEDSDEHNEYGDVVSDAVTDPTPRREQMEKRMRKLQTYLKEIPPTETYRYEDAEYAVVQWGGTRGVVEEAIDILRERGIKVGAIEVNHVFPLNPDIGDLLRGKKKIIVVENNFSGQFARLLRSEFLVQTELVTKYDGESFYPGALADEIEKKIAVTVTVKR
ncbi:2-oxoacid:ferredoxin oxidoreductase subunit alpha [Thermogymnomonas acidicola]|uniref:2-oxoglutarate synthase subunit KorA n=1 Tax=Thermogymnomonas acidicola TaxID=399579 RepID=A0AA37F8Z1_9ARCH|nr:2-oxoacid:acceptor oxidoreductase subunit alpha [Thermogymnomonas acidicola]GGM68068.1 2-oxoacid:ferredoxin oxidoreductase subunit alpha [Thermogymnomonas acidicola]